MPIKNHPLSTNQPGVPEAHAESEPRAPYQRSGAANSMPPDNGPPRRSQSPAQGPPAPRSGGPSVDRGLQAKPAVSRDGQARPAGEQNIHQTIESHPMGPLPENPNDHEQVYRFAMTFPGKKYSTEALAEIAENPSPATLDEVRAKLFFKALASKHRDDDEYLESYKDLKPLLEKYSKPEPT